jgi:hypothetical protein
VQVNTALAFSQLARQLRFDSSSSRAAALQHASYAQLLLLAEQQVLSLNPTKLAMILTSLAWMSSSSCSSSSSNGGDLEVHEQQQAAQLTPHLVSNIQQQQAMPGMQQSISATGGAASQQVASQQLLQLLAVRLQQQLDSAEPDEVCHCLWAFAKLQQLHNPAVLQLLDVATAHSLQTGWVHMLTAKPLSSLLWVHAQLMQQQQQQLVTVSLHQQQKHTTSVVQQQQQDGSTLQQQQQHLPVLLQAVMHELRQPGFLATWTPQELSMLLWSCAAFKLRIGQQQQQHGEVLNASQQQQQQEQQAVLPALPAAVVQEVCSLATQLVVRFTPQGIANTCLSLAKLLETTTAAGQQQQQQQALATAEASAEVPGVSQQAALQPSLQQSVQQLFDVFAAAAAAQLHYYKPQEVANLWSACARQQQHLQQSQQHLQQQQQQQQPYPALTAAVSQYALNHSHQLNPRDVFELLVGFVQLKTPVEPPVLHALLHRLGQASAQLQPYELIAAAWSLVRLAEDEQQQQHSKCLAAAHQLLDIIARQLGSEAEKTAAAALGGADSLQQVLSDSAGNSLVLLLWAVAGSGYILDQQQQQQHRQQLLAALLREVQHRVSTCSSATLLQLLVTLTRLQSVLSEQQQQQHLQSACATAAVRLQPLLQQLPAQQLVLAAWSLQKLAAASAGCSAVAAARDTASDTAGDTSSSCARGGTATTAGGLLLATVAELQQRQQLASLPADAAAAVLWCVTAARVTVDADVLLQLLSAAEQRVAQMSVRELAQLLQALAHQQQQQQSVVRLQSRLVTQAAERLQQQLQYFLLHATSNSSRQSGAAARPRKGGRLHSSSYPNSSSSVHSYGEVSSSTLLSIAASCARLPQLHASELLLAVLEVWQLQLDQQQQQQGFQRVQQTLNMLLMLSSGSSSSSSSNGSMATQLQDLLQQTLPQLQQRLAQQQQLATSNAAPAGRQSTAGVVVLAAQVFARLRYQPPPALLHLMSRQLQQSGLSRISSRDLVLLLHAYVHLGLPAQGLAAAVTATLQQRQWFSRNSVAEGSQGSAHFALLTHSSQVLLLWSLLTVFYAARHNQGSVKRMMVQLVTSVLTVKPRDEQPELQQLAMQCCELLQSPRYRQVSVALCSKLAGSGSVLRRQGELLQRLTQLSELLLVQREAPGLGPDRPDSFRLATRVTAAAAAAVSNSCSSVTVADMPSRTSLASGHSAAAGPDTPSLTTTAARPNRSSQASSAAPSGSRPGSSSSSKQLMSGRGLAQILQSSPQLQLLLLQQRVAAGTAGDGQQQHEVFGLLAPLLPLWLQQQRQRAGFKALALQLAAAGVASERLRCVRMAHGELALLVSAGEGSSSSGGSGGLNAGVAVVLEFTDSRASNTGRPLGPSILRNSMLAAKGYRVCSMPLGVWLSSWVSGGLSQQGFQAVGDSAAAVAERRKRDLMQQLLEQLSP